MLRSVFTPRLALSCLFSVMALFTFGQDKTIKIDSLLRWYHEMDALNGAVLVAEGDEIIFEKGFGKANFEWNIPNTPDTRFEIASISKFLTATLILKLVEEGHLSLQGKMADYYDGFPKDKGDQITLYQLLLHTSGLTDSRYIEGFEVTEGMMRKSHEEHIRCFSHLPLLFTPGTAWSYSNFGYHLLAIIAEKVTGKSFHALLNEKIFLPAGMKNSTTLEDPLIIKKMAYGYDIRFSGIARGLYHDPSFCFGIGSVVTTVQDYFLFWKALLKGKLLSPGNLENLFTPKTISSGGESFGFSLYFDQFAGGVSGSATILRCAGNHYGVHTLAYHLPGEDKLIVLFLNAKNFMVNIPSPIMFEIADQVTRILFNLPVERPKDSYARIFYHDELNLGLEAALKHYRELKRSSSCREHFTYFNRLGYFYLEQGRLKAALEVFKLNASVYPSNGDAYDSLGEALMLSGDKAGAIQNYRKAIALDPSNENAKTMLHKLNSGN